MAWATQTVIGSPAIYLGSAPDLVVTGQTYPKVALGTIVTGTDPYWGGGEFIYLQMPASQAVKVGGVLSYDVATAFLSALMANTAILGKAAALCVSTVASSATAQYAWCMISGQMPLWSSATVAANTGTGMVAAGQAGALAAGKQLNNCRVTLPATTAVTKTVTGTVNGSTRITRSGGFDGWFPGIAVTGTGVPASTTLSSIEPNGNAAVLSAACTADGSVTLTGTYNDATNFWNVVTCNRVSMQGPIT